MKKLGLNEIRKEYLDFFESKGHLVLKSYPLIPNNDKSLLLINAGMAPLKDYFTGVKKMSKNRATSSQKCIRTADIDNVGKTHRHGTFFEMLGNFSFGDYFKREAIHWAWEFLTERLELDKELLSVTVYEEDDEAYAIWRNEIGLPENKIQRLGKEDNFWELEVGPCGPCSEIMYDRGAKYENPDDRFMEIWNLVFTQFNKDKNGNYERLSNPNIDTGMGLERLTLVLEEKDNIFEIGLVDTIIKKIEEISKVNYKSNEISDISIRVIADHARAMTFLIYDGVIPSNEQRGYVLRRLIRRAARHGKLLGIKENFLTEVSKTVMEVYKSEYPELLNDSERIFKILNSEESKFQETIEQGLGILNSYIENEKEKESAVLSGDKAFKLYDTYGFPLDLTKEILEEHNMSVDEVEFNKLMENQKIRAREGRNTDSAGWSEKNTDYLKSLESTEFLGYTSNECVAKTIKIFKDEKEVKSLEKGDRAILISDKTVFYGEGGGQVGDIGVIESSTCKMKVVDTKKNKNNAIFHHVEVLDGTINLGDELNFKIDINNRRDIMKNHSATHLLHQALIEVLGSHINQAGSLVDANKLRFDITHFEAISEEDLKKVESIVNEKIALNLDTVINEMSLEESAKMGAIGLFEDKYKDVVRVVSFGGWSVELCGGTHVKNVSEIQMLKIISESGVAAGVRRIEAITGRKVYDYLNKKENQISDLSSILKVNKSDLVNKVLNLTEEIKILEKELKDIKSKMTLDSLGNYISRKIMIDDISFIAEKVEFENQNEIRDLIDKLRDKLGTSVIVLANIFDGKLTFTVGVSKDLNARKINAGNLVKEIAKLVGGNGGGRPDIASAGGKEIDKVDYALEKAQDILKSQL
ncbi:MAG: alanine--tRNA ligase [Peptoniphilaceae bacterium]|uniref:alanine--tRNA ligase n=1 Tax=Parvimonas sp. TaxID=1944660 RepID=UPI0025FEE827|nr:alanine--tRNA ligase [Parvimonas sp.]MCI5997637.1 alanine--tRNA ligase [Parvimonas sp.]MDD7765329.1 alanine--tRNA ligase [Peptoniphilaceae bacterium]MDY3051248.1 alanine--tRNA ligase [Parvimonas sp.]